jgi:hypothetical protein
LVYDTVDGNVEDSCALGTAGTVKREAEALLPCICQPPLKALPSVTVLVLRSSELGAVAGELDREGLTPRPCLAGGKRSWPFADGICPSPGFAKARSSGAARCCDNEEVEFNTAVEAARDPLSSSNVGIA